MKFIYGYNQQLRRKLETAVNKWDDEVRKYLPRLPNDLTIVFDNKHLIHDLGTGGFADGPATIYLAYDDNFRGDKSKQWNDLRGSFYHEVYHLAQGGIKWEKLGAIDESVLEGAASVFESDYTDTKHDFTQSPPREIAMRWLAQLRSLPLKYDVSKWKFYDPVTKERWIMYRTGVFVVREALKRSPKLRIENLVTKSPSDILKMAKL